jgi:hypothetical protein
LITLPGFYPDLVSSHQLIYPRTGTCDPQLDQGKICVFRWK